MISELRMLVAEWLLSAAFKIAPNGHPDKHVMARHLGAWALDMGGVVTPEYEFTLPPRNSNK